MKMDKREDRAIKEKITVKMMRKQVVSEKRKNSR